MLDYARFWKARSQVRWVSRPAVGGENIEIQSELPIAGLTLFSLRRIQHASGVPGIRWSDHEVILPDLNGNSHILVHVDYLPNQAAPDPSHR
jgi:hypothetical protein